MSCVEVEALLAEILDGSLQGATLTGFEAHQQSCASCRTMVEEARAGMHWMQALDEAEPPRNLVHNILAQTIGALPSEHAVVKPSGEGWLEKLKGRLAPMFAPIATPRFAMSFGMAFFSITMLLGIAGFHFADIRHWDLSSKGIRRSYYEAQARVMRYYENMRVVYEIESRVRDLRRAGTHDQNAQPQPQPPQQEAPAPEQKNPSKSDNRQHGTEPQKYSLQSGMPELAGYSDESSWVPRSSQLLARAARVREHVGSTLANGRPEWRTQSPLMKTTFGTAEAVSFPPQARQRTPKAAPSLSCLGPEYRRTA
jgi:hypothetical protein